MVDYPSLMDEAMWRTIKAEQEKRGLKEWKEHEPRVEKELPIESWFLLSGARLREARLKANMSLSDLEKRSGITKSQIGVLEHHECTIPHKDTARKLADALGITQEELDVECRTELHPIVLPSRKKTLNGRWILYKWVDNEWKVHAIYHEKRSANERAEKLTEETRVERYEA